MLPSAGQRGEGNEMGSGYSKHSFKKWSTEDAMMLVDVFGKSL